MRSVIESNAYQRDFQRESDGKYRLVLATELPEVVAMLIADIVLPAKYRDHMLTGNWAGHRECHIKPDLLLIYMKIESENPEDESGKLRLVRLGSHGKLYGL